MLTQILSIFTTAEMINKKKTVHRTVFFTVLARVSSLNLQCLLIQTIKKDTQTSPNANNPKRLVAKKSALNGAFTNH